MESVGHTYFDIIIWIKPVPESYFVVSKMNLLSVLIEIYSWIVYFFFTSSTASLSCLQNCPYYPNTFYQWTLY